LATLDVIRDERLLENAAELGNFALQRLREMAARQPLIGEVRGLGLILGVELVRPGAGGGQEPAVEEADAVLYRCLSRGLNFKTTMGNILTLTPPLILSREQLLRALGILEEAIAGVTPAACARKP